MNTAKWLCFYVVSLLLMSSLLPGCGGKVSRTLKGVPQVAVYYLGADTSRLDQDEVETFNKMALEMANNLVDDINTWGFEATLLKTQQSTFDYADKGYLLRFSLTPHRMVSKTAKSLMGKVAGPNIIEDHFEFIDLKSKKMVTWGEYTRDLELPMEVILKRKNDDAVFKIDTIINNQ